MVPMANCTEAAMSSGSRRGGDGGWIYNFGSVYSRADNLESDFGSFFNIEL